MDRTDSYANAMDQVVTEDLISLDDSGEEPPREFHLDTSAYQTTAVPQQSTNPFCEDADLTQPNVSAMSVESTAAREYPAPADILITPRDCSVNLTSHAKDNSANDESILQGEPRGQKHKWTERDGSKSGQAKKHDPFNFVEDVMKAQSPSTGESPSILGHMPASKSSTPARRGRHDGTDVTTIESSSTEDEDVN